MRFCLHFTNADVSDEMADNLYAITTGDATLYQRNGAAFADFDRSDAGQAGFQVADVGPVSEEQDALDKANALLTGRN
jgi:hypothetical protein